MLEAFPPITLVYILAWIIAAMHPQMPNVAFPPAVVEALAKIGAAADKVSDFVDHGATDAFYAGVSAGGLGGLIVGVLVGLILAGLYTRRQAK